MFFFFSKLFCIILDLFHPKIYHSTWLYAFLFYWPRMTSMGMYVHCVCVFVCHAAAKSVSKLNHIYRDKKFIAHSTSFHYKREWWLISVAPMQTVFMKFETKYEIFGHESAFEYVICKIVTILSWSQGINTAGEIKPRFIFCIALSNGQLDRHLSVWLQAIFKWTTIKHDKKPSK